MVGDEAVAPVDKGAGEKVDQAGEAPEAAEEPEGAKGGFGKDVFFGVCGVVFNEDDSIEVGGGV